MCVVSMVGDHYKNIFEGDDFRKRYDDWATPSWPNIPSWPPKPDAVSRQEFNEAMNKLEELKRKVEEMIALMKKAAEYDRKNNQPSCEKEDKIKFLREISEKFGIDFDKEVFGKE